MTDCNSYENIIFDHFFSEEDRMLIRALAGVEFNAVSAQKLTKDLDVDSSDVLYLLLLGILGYRSGWEYFPQNMTPRFQGLHRYYQVRNAAESVYLRKKLDNLRSEGISAMLSGAAATRTVFLSDTPRFISGYDLTVPSGSYEKALAFFEHGDTAPQDTEAANAMVKEPLFRLHRGTPDKRLFSEKSVWESAVKTKLQNYDIFVPSLEHTLLFHLCVPYGGWVVGERHTDKVLRITEALNIISKNVRPDGFAEAAGAAGLQAVARLYFVLLRSVIPEVSHADDFLLYLPEDHSYLDYTKQLAKLCRLFGPGSKNLSLRKKVSLHNGRKHIQKMLEKQKEKTDVR